MGKGTDRLHMGGISASYLNRQDEASKKKSDHDDPHR